MSLGSTPSYADGWGEGRVSLPVGCQQAAQQAVNLQAVQLAAALPSLRPGSLEPGMTAFIMKHVSVSSRASWISKVPNCAAPAAACAGMSWGASPP
jgi:hypothetical protein